MVKNKNRQRTLLAPSWPDYSSRKKMRTSIRVIFRWIAWTAGLYGKCGGFCIPGRRHRYLEKACMFIFNIIWSSESIVVSCRDCQFHYDDVIMGAIASQITSLTIVYWIVYSDADQWKHQSSASLAFVRGIHRGPLNSLHKWPVTRKMFPFDDVIMCWALPCPRGPS